MNKTGRVDNSSLLRRLVAGTAQLHRALTSQDVLRVARELSLDLSEADGVAVHVRGRAPLVGGLPLPLLTFDPYSRFSCGRPAFVDNDRVLYLPLMNGRDEVIGALVFFREKAFPFGGTLIEVLEHLAHLIAISLEKTELMQQAEARERQLALEIEKYHNFIAQSSEGVWRVEAPMPVPPGPITSDEIIPIIFKHAYIAECNDAMAKMYGFERAAELIGMPLSRLLIPDEPNNIAFLKTFLESGYRLVDAESIERDRFGNIRYFLNTMVGVLRNGVLVGAWGTQRDITEQKQMQEKLLEGTREAQAANSAKTAFLASISHEIRTPLSVIMGFAELVLEVEDLPAQARAHVEGIRRNGLALSRLLGAVLDLSKIEARRLEIERLRIPLMPMVEDLMTSMEMAAREKGLHIRLRTPGPLPKFLRTDPTRLRQVLINLVGNAIKFTDEGEVSLTVRFRKPPKPGAIMQLEFTVADQGIGIDPNIQSRLFQPFVQAESSTSRKYGGTGLGLALSKQLAQALGGDLILAKSVPNEGSIFTFHIDGGIFEGELTRDVQLVPPSSLGASDVGWDLGLQGKRILVVEDSEDNQMLIQHYLNAAGLEVELAANGLEGIEKATSAAHDLVLMDIQMPGLDGHEATRRLRESGYEKPIVALTAHAFVEERERAFKNGFSEYLTKPINRKVLLQMIQHRLLSPDLH